MFEFKLPDLGEGIHEGEILKWHVQPGDTIKEDDPLVEVETDKAAVTIPSPRSGKVVQVVGKPGDVVHVGQVIAVIDDGSGAGVAATPPAVASKPAPFPAAAAPTASPIASASASASGATPQHAGPVPAAPATRRLARELGVDLRAVTPTGPAGRVTPEDVRHHAAGRGPAPVPATGAGTREASPTAHEAQAQAEFAAHAASVIPYLDIEPLPDFAQLGPVETEPLRSIRRKTAHKMVTSAILVPHVAHMDEADVTPLEELRRRERDRRQGQPGAKLTLLPFVVRAVVAGLRRHPMFNASVDPFRELIVVKKFYNVGVAVDSGHGLVVPVLHAADGRSVLDVSLALEALSAQAREGKLDIADLRGGTFTITNVGAIGGTSSVPIINYPEVAILALGRMQEKPVVREGQIVIRKMLPLTLAFDHRVADGADAARFMNDIVRLLSDPATLVVEG
jgi:pyruvate dehydrogenase E2 component (dihydrolipoamide acetyltransferase)